jgi:serine/threonine protein kinase
VTPATRRSPTNRSATSSCPARAPRLSQATPAKLAGVEHEPVIVGEYELERLVGIGGMGRVFAARSLQSDRRVALKILHRTSAGALLGLKREFRVLAEVEHPNLVGLDSLVVAGEGEGDSEAFFTMELVNGVPFVDYVRGRLRRGTPPNELRLRRALIQLVSAIEHLHAGGYVHRDLKPSNVLVTEDGRVVVLDFGLVDELGPTGELGDEHILGTPAYMAPEQAALEGAGPPADLYAIGVMLFESLCGARPFVGNMKEVLAAKRDGPARDVAEFVSGCDPELLALCRELLAREVERRPSAGEVLERLRRRPAVDTSGAAPTRAAFVGRRAELAALDGALADLRAHPRPLLALVSGPSGQGKSSLLTHWLASLDGDELILRGRCLERESVPYKGLDAVIDALSNHLRRLPALAMDALRPPDVAELVRLFPVLEAVWPEPGASAAGLEPAERRERAVSGLRELLGRLAHARTLVLVLDDFHWADTDSSALLVQLLDHVAGPPLLLVVGYRDPPDPGPALARLQALEGTPRVALRELELGPLSEAEAHELVLPMLAGDAVEADTIVRAAGGNPVYLRELARGRPEGEQVDLDRLIVRRIRGLSPPRRRALTLVALAGGPIERAALRAAGCDEAELDALLADELLRVSELDAEQVEVGQEQIAPLAVAELDADELPRYHLRLATALAGVDASPELLAKHFERGGQRERAFIHAERAAKQAMEALAFRRAAEWFERCLEWLPPGEGAASSRWALERELVTAYVNSGRLVDGAELLLAQAREPGVEDPRGLRIRAVEYLLHAGHMQAGLREAAELLEAVGLSLPRSRARMVINVLAFRRRLARDLARLDAGLSPREEPQLRERARVCGALANGFMSHDGLVCLHFNILTRRLAIALGDRRVCARTLGIDAVFSSTAGWTDLVPKLLARARELCEGHERERLWLAAMDIHAAGNLAELSHGLEIYDSALTELEARPDVQWERHMATDGAVWLQVLAGRYRRAIDAARRDVEIGVELGNLKQARDGSGLLAWALVCVGEFDEAEQVIARVEALERGVIDPQHYMFANVFRDMARIRRRLRTGEGERALAAARELPAKMKRDGLWHVVTFRLEALAMIACAELQLWLRAPSRRGRRRLRGLIRKLRDGMGYQPGNAAVIEAAMRELDGDREGASTLYAEAEELFAKTGAEGHLAATRMRWAGLVGGEEGERLRAQAEAFFDQEQVVDPDGLVRVFAPGS